MTSNHDRGDNPNLDPRNDDRFELVREGARRDGVEIVHYAPRFAVEGTRAERRVVRTIGLCFLVTFLAGVGFAAVYVFWPWEPHGSTGGPDKVYTTLLGLLLGVTLLGLGLGVVSWAKKLLPEEVSIQDRHDGASSPEDASTTAATIANMGVELGVTRRPLLKYSLGLGALGVGAAAVMPLGALVKNPHSRDQLIRTGWAPGSDGKPIRLVREDGTPVRPDDVSVGGQITVFPDIPGGASNEHADSPTLLIHLDEQAARQARDAAENSSKNRGSQWGNFVAFSKICTHAGCPASLYERRTNKLLCPCHQSQFRITDNARPIFGPASRRLPQLPLDVDSQGYFVARHDYPEPIGPGFWERPS